MARPSPEAGKKWREATWVAFDTETSGRYPIESEICEIAAVKWKTVDGVATEVESFASLIKPTKSMSAEVIKIHGITNEMVAEAPPIAEVLPKFLEFIEGSVLLAHHAQFDLGFVANALEDCNLQLPDHPTVCTSLLAQGNVPETPNHRLQTLVPFFGVDPGQAHRALDDARACLNVAIKIIERLQLNSENHLTVDDIAAKMLRRTSLDLGLLYFSRFSMNELRQNENLKRFIEAARTQTPVQLTYAGGSRKGQARTITPIGVIRQLDGDALVALELGDTVSKRYWIKDVVSIE
jgi:DNA polymerase-3 subunit epsilon